MKILLSALQYNIETEKQRKESIINIIEKILIST